MAAYRLEQLLDMYRMQQMLELQCRFSQTACSVIDGEGKTLFAAGYQQPWYTLHRRAPQKFAPVFTAEPASHGDAADEKPMAEFCDEYGARHIQAKIIVAGQKLATLFLEHFYYSDAPLDQAILREKIQTEHIDTDRHEEAVRHIPVYHRDRLKDFIHLLQGLIESQAETGIKNLDLLTDLESNKPIESRLGLKSFALDNIGEAVFLINDGRQVVYVNQGACRLCGLTKAEMYGSRIDNILPNLAPELTATAGYRQAKKLDMFIRNFRNREGMEVPAEIDIISFQLDGKAHRLILIRDISARTRMEQAIFDRAKQYRSLLASIPNFIVRYDTKLCRTYVNPAWEKITGLTGETVLNLPISTNFDSSFALAPEYITCLEKVLATGVQETLELEWRDLHGELRFLHQTLVPEHDVKGKLTGILSIGRDITERKKAEKERHENLIFFQNLDRINSAIKSSADLESLLGQLLDLVLEIFAGDRACLIHPCDPHAALCQITAERSTPVFRSVTMAGAIIPMDKDLQEMFRCLKTSDQPQAFGAKEQHVLPTIFQTNFAVQSQLFLTVSPKFGQPWALGLLQCSDSRLWTGKEKELFKEIGRRLEDALTGFLTYRRLQESEARYRLIVETATEGILTIGSNFLINFANARIARMLGYNIESLLGRSLIDFIFKEDFQDHRRRMQRCRQGIPAQYEQRLKRGDGMPLWTIVSIAPTIGSDQLVNGAIVMISDITDRKHAETLLKEREQAFRAVVENSPDTIARYDRECRRTYVNPAMQRFINHPLKKIIGTKPTELSPLPEPESFEKLLRAVITSKKDFQGELLSTTPSGKSICIHYRIVPEFDLKGKVISTLVIGRDITARRQTEEALRESEERLRLTLEATGIGTWDWDVVNDVWSASPVYYTMLGYPPQPGKGERREWISRVHPEDHDRIQAMLVKVLTRDFTDYRYEARIRHADGSYRWQFVQGLGIRRDKEGLVTRMLGIRMDIDDRKKAEKILEASQREFRSLAMNMTDLLVRYDRTGRIVYINPTLERYLGTTLSTAIGKTPRELKKTADMEEINDWLDHVMVTKTPLSKELMVSPDNGRNIFHQINFIPEFDDRGELSGVLAIGRDITELKISSERILEKQKRINDMTLELSMAEDRERRRVASELHDNLGQELTLARIKLGGLMKRLRAPQQKLTAEEIRLPLERAISRVRRFTRLVSPPILESAGLDAALKWLTRQIAEEYDITIAFEDDLQYKPVSREHQLEIYNSVRELLINVVKHAKTDAAKLAIARREERFVARVEDQGLGFSLENTAEPASEGFGLFNIERRINYLGGQFTIETAPNKGTKITFSMPLMQNPDSMEQSVTIL